MKSFITVLFLLFINFNCNNPSTDSSIRSDTVNENNIIRKVSIKSAPPKPVYPHQALFLKLSGVVVVYIEINENGEPMACKALSGHDLLKPAAESYAMSFRFYPASIGGKNVQSKFILDVPFKFSIQ
jgi:outer membrane biosynthesis protein TonB